MEGNTRRVVRSLPGEYKERKLHSPPSSPGLENVCLWTCSIISWNIMEELLDEQCLLCQSMLKAAAARSDRLKREGIESEQWLLAVIY